MKKGTLRHSQKKVSKQRSSQLLSKVRELYFAGGAGAGLALRASVLECIRNGLNLDKVKVVCGTSVGALFSLALSLDIPSKDLKKTINSMPGKKFMDWSWWDSLSNFPSRWGWCKGQAIPNYCCKIIKEFTGLEDPTFLELYQAGFKKELRVITANLTRGEVGVFSYRTTPNFKVATAVSVSCSVPVLFPPTWINGELHTDGGIIKNYPFAVGSQESDINKQLGFIFVNKATGLRLNEIETNPINSFFKYLGSLFWSVVFQEPLTLPDEVKRRTIAIDIDHPPWEFEATDAVQKRLNKAGRQGTINLMKQIRCWQKVENKRSHHKSEIVPSSKTLRFSKTKHNKDKKPPKKRQPIKPLSKSHGLLH